MSCRVVVSALVLLLASPQITRSAPPALAQAEIQYLLTYVGKSDCQFFRNGSWHDAKSAQAHIRYKYERLAASDQITTAEDFIDKAATKSSISGQPYQVKCIGSDAMSTNQWLRAVLAQHR
jgi:hypothetical protein